MASYYIAGPSGSDSNNGLSQATAWATTAKIGTTSFSPGDIIYLNRGQVFEPFTLSSSGSSGNSIIIDAYGTGALPVISGFVEADTWSATDDDDIYEFTHAKFDTKTHMVLVDGEFQKKGRLPKAGTYRITTGGGDDDSVEAVGNTDTSRNLPTGIDFTGAEIVIRKNHFIEHTLIVDDHVGDELQYGSDLSNKGTYPPQVGYGFFLQNHQACLTEFGDWRYDTAEEKIYMNFKDSGPELHEVKIATSAYGINLNAVSRVLIRNIRIEGIETNGINFNGTCSYVTIQACQIQYCGTFGISAEGTGVSNITILNNEISDCNVNGINIYYTNNNIVVERNYVHDIFTVSGSGGRRGNADGRGIGIFVPGSTSSKIIYNRVVNVGFNGIHGTGNGMEIDYNFVDNTCFIKDDGAGIYLSIGGTSMNITSQMKVRGNIVLNSMGNNDTVLKENTIDGLYIAYGIYLDDEVHNCEVSGNLVKHSRGGGFYGHNCENVTVTGNIWYDCMRCVNWGQDSGLLIRDVVYTNNTHVTTDTYQKFINVASSGSDYDQWGTFSNNKYYHMNDNVALFEGVFGSSTRYNFGLTPEEWADLVGETDYVISEYQQLVPAEYTPVSVIGENSYPNEAATNTFGLAGAVTFVDNGTRSWSAGKMVITKTNPANRASAYMSTGGLNVDINKAYVLTLSLSSDKEEKISVNFEHSYGSAYSYPVSKQVITGPEEKEYKMYLTRKENWVGETILLLFEIPFESVRVDNFKLEEVDFEYEADMQVFYNDDPDNEIVVDLGEQYYTVPNNSVVTQVTIPPMGFMLLKRIGEVVPDPIGFTPKIPLYMIEDFQNMDLNFVEKVNFVLPPTSELDATQDDELVKWSQIRNNNSLNIAYGLSKLENGDLRIGTFEFGSTLYTMGTNIPFRSFGTMTQAAFSEDINALQMVDKGATGSGSMSLEYAIVNFNDNSNVGVEITKHHTNNTYNLLISKNVAAGYQAIDFANNGRMFVYDGINSKGLEYIADYSSAFTDHSLVTKLWVENELDAISGTSLGGGLSTNSEGEITLGTGQYLNERYLNLDTFLDEFEEVLDTFLMYKKASDNSSLDLTLKVDSGGGTRPVGFTIEQTTSSNRSGIRLLREEDSTAVKAELHKAVGNEVQSIIFDYDDTMKIVDIINEKGLEDGGDYSANKTQYSYITPAWLRSISGYSGTVAQTLTHDASGEFLWVNS